MSDTAPNQVVHVQAPPRGVVIDAKTIGVAFAVVVQLCATVWWGAALDHRLGSVEQEQRARSAIRELPTRLEYLANEIKGLRTAMDDIDKAWRHATTRIDQADRRSDRIELMLERSENNERKWGNG